VNLLAGLILRIEVSIVQEQHGKYGNHDAEGACHACCQVAADGNGLVKLLVEEELNN
jgi:hypothetical protein